MKLKVATGGGSVLLVLVLGLIWQRAHEDKWLEQFLLSKRTIAMMEGIAKEKAMRPIVWNALSSSWPDPPETLSDDMLWIWNDYRHDAPSPPSPPRGGRTARRRIFWAYWDSGIGGLPEVCRLALRSWTIRNPSWTVILMNRTNYHQFVSTSDLPNTFDSLIVQHQSDILRFAVLIRYGGVYLDVTTMMYRGLDDIWTQLSNSYKNQLALTPMIEFPDNVGPYENATFYNNAILIAPQPNNPVLTMLHERIIEYMEAKPGFALEEMLRDPLLDGLQSYMTHTPSLGVLATRSPYSCNLWLLTKLLAENETLRTNHVVHLPSLEWGMFAFSLDYWSQNYYESLRSPPKPKSMVYGANLTEEEEQEEENKYGGQRSARRRENYHCVLSSKNGDYPDFGKWALVSCFMALGRHFVHDDEQLAHYVASHVAFLKVFKEEFRHLDYKNSTFAHILRAATDTTILPTVQATLP